MSRGVRKICLSKIAPARLTFSILSISLEIIPLPLRIDLAAFGEMTVKGLHVSTNAAPVAIRFVPSLKEHIKIGLGQSQIAECPVNPINFKAMECTYRM